MPFNTITLPHHFGDCRFVSALQKPELDTAVQYPLGDSQPRLPTLNSWRPCSVAGLDQQVYPGRQSEVLTHDIVYEAVPKFADVH